MRFGSLFPGSKNRLKLPKNEFWEEDLWAATLASPTVTSSGSCRYRKTKKTGHKT